MAREGRLKLFVLSGYLGAGKTTFLRHALFAGRYGKPHVIVQEAAERPVDNLLLERAESVTVLSGKAGTEGGLNELLAALLDLVEARTSPDRKPRPETLVIETSGLTDPGTIVGAIEAHPVLVHHILLQEVVVMADAAHFGFSLSDDPLCRAQVMDADRIVITKSDCVTVQDLSNLVAALTRLNPSAPVTQAIFGVESPLPDLPPPTERYDPAPDSTRPPISVMTLSLPDDIDWIEFTVWLSALLHARGDRILRVKGVIRTDAGLLLLQAVRRVVQHPEVLPPEGKVDGVGDVVFIGERMERDELLGSLHQFLGKPAP